mmetsp:Transcript_6473/g.14241  ORF Transcript_6473/g.14241 Transcript_6473/m.14241 type:complete len:225 (-) Transcript_6473:102-776(-)
MLEEAFIVFLDAAELEYDRLTGYVDAYSKLSHAVSDANKRGPLDQLGVHVGGSGRGISQPAQAMTGGGQRSETFDRITTTFQRSELPFVASHMFDQIEAVRDAHANLLDSFDDVVEAINEADAASRTCSESGSGGSASVPGRHNSRQRRLLKKHAALKAHTELSQRVVKTVCSSGVGQPIIHPNGMMATDETNEDGNTTQHQQRVVAMATLRASIAKVKEAIKT